jgi:hypothetical protein
LKRKIFETKKKKKKKVLSVEKFSGEKINKKEKQ